MRRLTKDESRQRSSELRELLWRWDPIGVSSLPDWPRDEYDCLVGRLMRDLESGNSLAQIADYLKTEIKEHFGLDPEHYDFMAVATELHTWFSSNWPDTMV